MMNQITALLGRAIIPAGLGLFVTGVAAGESALTTWKARIVGLVGDCDYCPRVIGGSILHDAVTDLLYSIRVHSPAGLCVRESDKGLRDISMISPDFKIKEFLSAIKEMDYQQIIDTASHE